jgi:hypothetical protein
MRTSEEAKTYACEVSSRCLTAEESERRLQRSSLTLDELAVLHKSGGDEPV